jgi:predicted small lipoprotein YifL
MNGLRRGAAIISVVLAALLLLSACGRRGDLEAPLGQPDTSRRVYPAQ